MEQQGLTLKETTMAWLQSLCPVDRRDLAAPFRATAEDALWACASDGHYLVAVRVGDPSEAPESEFPRAEEVVRIIECSRGEPFWTGDVSALRAWLGPIISKSTCPDCKGSPSKECNTCGGSGEDEHYCDHRGCNESHTADCYDCKGTGGGCDRCDSTGQISPPREPILLGSSPVGAHLLRKIISNLEGTISFRTGCPLNLGGNDPLALIGDTGHVRFVLMPLRYEKDQIERRFPAEENAASA